MLKHIPLLEDKKLLAYYIVLILFTAGFLTAGSLIAAGVWTPQGQKAFYLLIFYFVGAVCLPFTVVTPLEEIKLEGGTLTYRKMFKKETYSLEGTELLFGFKDKRKKERSSGTSDFYLAGRKKGKKEPLFYLVYGDYYSLNVPKIIKKWAPALEEASGSPVALDETVEALMKKEEED